MKKVVIFGLTATLLFVAVNPVAAVTNGTPDGEGHPYVGLILFYDNSWNYLWRCSGALLSPTVVLTAGHCTYDTVTPPSKARVLFAADLTLLQYPYPNCGPYTCYQGTPYPHSEYQAVPGHGLVRFDSHDVGVVVLDTPIVGWDKGFAALPAEGLVDTLPMMTNVDLVGYGVQEQIRGGGPPVWAGPRVRMHAPTLLVQSDDVISDEYIKLTANPAQGKGGTCFGDSGGPDLLGGTNIILAVNSFVTNGNCAGVTYSNRVDTYALDWISGFLD